MHLYHLTLQKPTAINVAVYGNFSAPKAHEFVIARGTVIELLRPQEPSYRLETIVSYNVFGQVRSLIPLRLLGQTTDYIVVTSDAGKIIILQYRKESNEFIRIHEETYGKTGVRRIVPGYGLTKEPHGRAIMVTANEKQKFVYVLNRDDKNNLTISSPLEAHRPHTLVMDTVGLDNGFENPVFACLEMDYGDIDTDPTPETMDNLSKHVTYYELDLGLNHVLRKWTKETDRNANLLLPVPGADSDGPGGVLVLAENWILYEHSTHTESIRIPIPRRTDMPDERGLLLVSWAMHKSKSGFFFLVQSELGDIYKLTLTIDPSTKKVNDIVLKYFDTVPVMNSLCITRRGLLFGASEFSNHLLYELQSLGDDDTTAATSHAIKIDPNNTDASIEIDCPVFAPRPLRNLTKIDETSSLAPIIDSRVMVPSSNPASIGLTTQSVTQMLTLCGRGPRSSLRILRQGLAINEIAVSPMPSAPLSVFTLKTPDAAISYASSMASSSDSTTVTEPADRYLVLSFANATVVLSVGDSIDDIPAKDIGFTDAVPTLAVGVLADGSYLQIYPNAMRMVPWTATGERGAPREWKPPPPRKIVRAAVNDRQVVLALSGGDIIYFEYDANTRMLAETGRKQLGAEVTAIALPTVPPGRLRASYVALADTNNMVRIMSLDPERLLVQASVQALRAGAESLALANMKIHSNVPTPHLFIGLQNGVLSRLTLDPATGILSDPRVRFLGVKPVKVLPLTIAGNTAILALSTRPYLAYNLHGKYLFQSLSYETLVHAAPFTTGDLKDSFVAVAGNTFRVASIDRLGSPFSGKSVPLRYTPRRMAFHTPTGLAVIATADHNPYNRDGQKKMASLAAEAHPDETQIAQNNVHISPTSGLLTVETEGTDPQAESIDPRRIGTPLPNEKGIWASSLHVVDISMLSAMEASNVVSTTDNHPTVHHILELDNNEAALSIASCTFHDHPGEQFLLVGCVKDMQLHPRSFTESSIHTYRLVPGNNSSTTLSASDSMDTGDNTGSTTLSSSSSSSSTVASGKYRLELLHRTVIEDIPLAITPFLGRVLVGAGKSLSLFDLGKKKLLRKCENKNAFPTLVQNIQTSMDRIFVSDSQESIHFVKYKRAENVFVTFADDTYTRHMTTALVLDHDTVIGGDKFGNVFVLRLPADVSDNVDKPSGDQLIWSSALLNGAANKCTQIASFHIGSVVTSLQKAVLTAGGTEVIVYTTITGAIGVLAPLAVKDDVDFFTHLELFMRNENVSLIGRDHTSFRSSYAPVSHVFDGDLCEYFTLLSFDKQRSIANELDRTSTDIMKKLEDIRNKLT